MANWFGKGKRGLIMGVWNAHTSVGEWGGRRGAWGEGALWGLLDMRQAGREGRIRGAKRSGEYAQEVCTEACTSDCWCWLGGRVFF